MLRGFNYSVIALTDDLSVQELPLSVLQKESDALTPAFSSRRGRGRFSAGLDIAGFCSGCSAVLDGRMRMGTPGAALRWRGVFMYQQ